MSFALRTLIVAFASFAAAGLVVGTIVPWLACRRGPAVAAERARRLARLRLLPAASGVVVALAATGAFLIFESRAPRESVSWIVIGFAACGAALVATSAWRWCLLSLATHRATRRWFATAERVQIDGMATPAVAVDTTFPIVAVVGLFKPTLVIARSVLASCSPDELRAILAHEQSHLNRRDNLRRLAMTATPDVLAWLPASARLFAAWCEATEEAADADAARVHDDGRLHLASALVKVARLATGSAAAPAVPAAALYTGENLDSRVRQLLAPPLTPVPRGFDAWNLLILLAIAIIVLAAQTPGVHGWLETAVHALP